MGKEGNLKRTPLYEEHVALGARMIPFGGWEMPVQYKGIIEEHETVRQAAGLFDLSHMGELVVGGPRALPFLQWLTPNNVAALEVGQAQYSMLLNPQGGIVDDIIVYRRADDYFLVVNAANIAKDLAWLQQHLRPGVEVTDLSQQTALLAVQGPRAAAIVQELTPVNLEEVPYYGFTMGPVHGMMAMISRTGYTGEDGFELYIPPQKAVELWRRLLEVGKEHGLAPIGLGARDTLRLEMRYPLYGNDLTEETTPLEAGLEWVVKFEKGDFLGREALLAQKERGVSRRLVGLVMVDRGVSRHGYPVTTPDGEREIGYVTSGSYSPTRKENIALAYVEPAFAPVGSTVGVRIRDRVLRAQVVKTPFVPSHTRR